MSDSGVYTTVNELLGLRHLAQGLTLKARRKAKSLADGNVIARYRGRGMEFAEVRPYQAGDDIRTIDWRVTARMQSPYTKLFQEEHERPVFIITDQRSPMFFGSRTVFKSVFAARLAATVGWIAQANNDRVGALVFGDNNQSDTRPRRGKRAVLELINHLVGYNTALARPTPQTAPTPFSTMLKEASRVARPGSLVILISDFSDFDDSCRESLAHLAKRCDMIGIHLYDPLEVALPERGQFAVSNARDRLQIDTRQIGRNFTQAFTRHSNYVKGALLGYGIQYASTPVDTPFDEFVRDLFQRRANAGRPRAGGRSK